LEKGSLNWTLLHVDVAVLQGSEQDGDTTTAASASRLFAVVPHVWLLGQSGDTVDEPY